MFIGEVGFQEQYEDIKRGAIHGGESVLILVSPDADALCACRMLVGILRTDLIAHKVLPVSSYSDLTALNDEVIADNDELRSVVLLNCGGVVNVQDFLSLNDQVRCYVIDSHRPYNLDNLFGNHQVVVFDDGEIEHDLRDERLAYEETEFQDSNDEEEEEEEEEGDGDEELAPDAQSQDADDESDNDDDGNDDDQDREDDEEESDVDIDADGDVKIKVDVDAGERKRARRRRRQEMRRLLIEYYAEGSYYGLSVSETMYILADRLNRKCNDYLWCAIVGLTDQLVHERIDTQRYIAHAQNLRQEVARFNPTSQSSVVNGMDMDAIGSQSLRAAAHTPLRPEEEYKFMLFRHWSLYDSMFHSWYIASKLTLWRDHGRNRLNNLFAKMGFSLKECNQMYTHMDAELKRLLKLRMSTVGPEFGLDDLTYSSFTRSFGYKYTLSASDAVFALTALLEAGPRVATEIGHYAEWADVVEDVREGKLWYRNFYIAYDAVNDINILRFGLELSMDLQRAIMRQGTAVIQKPAIKTLKNFRYALVKDGPDLSLFSQPLALTKLALFLFNAMRSIGRTNLPLVVATLNEAAGTYLVVGFTGAAQPGEPRKNKFGLAFQATAADTSARVRHDAFESSVMEISKDDVADFLERLQLHMHRGGP
ncbi:DNA replication initiation factor cdc45 [Sorochytrium milnesiophthora]